MVEPWDGAPPLRQAFSLIRERVVELEPALLDLVEHVFERHQLGEARRRHQLIAVLVEQQAVAVGVEQDGGGNAGLERFVLFGRHRGAARRGRRRGLRQSRRRAARRRRSALPSPATQFCKNAAPARRPPPVTHLNTSDHVARNRACASRAMRQIERVSPGQARARINKARGRSKDRRRWRSTASRQTTWRRPLADRTMRWWPAPP